MQGQAVPNSPLTVALHPGPICLKRSSAVGATTNDHPCVAGEEHTIYIRPVDACGHFTAADGSAEFHLKIISKTERFQGELH